MKKFENFCNALENLKDIYNYQEPYGNVELTDMVGLYEIYFEQAWKAMKELLERDGFSEGQTGSPRQILQTAYSAHLISDEEIWLSALAARNNVVHAYNQTIALSIVSAVKTQYYQMFLTLKKTMETYDK